MAPRDRSRSRTRPQRRRLLAAGRPVLAAAAAVLVLPAPGPAQEPDAPAADSWDVTQPRGQTREIDFTTSEGTWLSVDVSPDGGWLVFDLLGHVYRVGAAGGEAVALTQNSGVAVNFHPRISPDGRHIAFVSDRGGQNNLWLMEADGSNPRAVFTDRSVRVVEPAWTPDGQYIVFRRSTVGGGGGQGGAGIWMVHRDGGSGVELVSNRDAGRASWPSVSRDGRYLYFHMSPGNERDVLRGGVQLQRFEFRTGEMAAVTSGQAAQQSRGSSGGGYAPEVSPDGRWLAFARRLPDGTISHKGHQFGPRTALWLRDLETGAERLLMDPVEIDNTEGIKTLRVLPGYAWAPDGRSIVIAQGGRIRRVDVASGQVATIPFTARVRRTISEMAYRPFRIEDGPFRVRFIRWPAGSPAGSAVLFQAVGKLWATEPGASPRRLTPASFEPFEFSPAWSPDGRWIAFTTWDEREGGHVWRVGAGGGTPQRVTQQAGEYIHPAWSPDGRGIVVARGAGATRRGRGMAANPWYELVRLPAEGGNAEAVVRVASPSGRRQLVQPAFGPDGRIFYVEQKRTEEQVRGGTIAELTSIRPDGLDRRVHATFLYADEVAPSPDGRWVAFQEGDNVYLAPFPWIGTGKDPIRIEKKRGKLNVRQLSLEGGLFPRWRNATTLEFASGSRYYAHDVATGRTDTTVIELSVPRDVPRGSIALAGARIITLEDRQVIERGTVLVENGRIRCVGDCDAAGAARVIDVAGKTIIPGLVDMHAHHYREHQGILPPRSSETAIYLAYGVTTNLDNSMWSQNIFPAAELIDAGLMIGPRTFSTGDPLYAGDGPRQNEMASRDVAEQNVRRLADWGAVSIKQYLQPRRDQRQWVTDAARRHGLMVTSEGGDLAYNLGMIMDGHTAFEHPMSYTPIYSDVARFFGLARAVYSPTFIVGGPGPWNEEYFFQEYELWQDPKQRRFMPWRQLVPHTRRRTLRPVTDYSFPMIAQGLADIIQHGGFGAIGSHGQHHGIGSHWEVWMAAAALGPMGALEVASLHGAYFLGADPDIGSIREGKLADLVVLNSNPLDDIRNTADIRYVMKAGVLYDGDTLDELWPRQRPFGPYYWVDDDALRSDVRATDHFDRR